MRSRITLRNLPPLSAQKEVLSTFLQVVLPDSTRLEYHQFLLKDKKQDNAEHFLEFLQIQLEAEIRNQQQGAVFAKGNNHAKKGGTLAAWGEGETDEESNVAESHCFLNDHPKPAMCDFCSTRPHPLFRCHKFASSSYEEKIKYVKAKNLCFKCLKAGHLVKECSLLISCEFCESPD